MRSSTARMSVMPSPCPANVLARCSTKPEKYRPAAAGAKPSAFQIQYSAAHCIRTTPGRLARQSKVRSTSTGAR